MSDSHDPRKDRRNAPARLFDWNKISQVLRRHRLLWLAPTIVFSVLGTMYALTKNDQWRASQALLVRDEAVGELGFGSLGRFDSSDSLKRSLETILQIAKNEQVVAEALRQLSPEQATHENWPDAKAVARLQDDISVAAPKGTEFGMTEVIYLSVPAGTPEEAVAVNKAVCEQLQRRMQQLRDQHAQGVITELNQKVKLARSELDQATAELSKLEQELGSDLGEMRTLVESGSSGESNLRSQVNQIKVELRQAESDYEAQLAILNRLTAAGNDIEAILASPNRLLETQPSLRRLRDGLVDAQLRTAQLQGTMTDNHPLVRAALENERQVRQQLQREVKSSRLALQADLAVSEQLVASTKRKLNEVQSRLHRLASQRATYGNQVDAVRQRQEQLREAQASLSEARARQEAALHASLITRLGEPTTGSTPVGPGRATIAVGSVLGGLAVGLSLVYLVAPWQSSSTNAAGRRAADRARQQRSAGRRRSDVTVDAPTPRRRRADKLSAEPASDDFQDDVDWSHRDDESEASPRSATLKFHALDDDDMGLAETPRTSGSLQHLTRILESKCQ